MRLRNLRVKLRGAGFLAQRTHARARRQQHPHDSAPATVVAVPWRALRDSTGRLRAVCNIGTDPALQVRLLMAGSGVFSQSLPTTVLPGEQLNFHANTAHATDHSSQTVVVRWLNQDGKELLWSAPMH